MTAAAAPIASSALADSLAARIAVAGAAFSELGPAEWLLAAAALGVVVATSGALKHANHQADTALKDKASDKPCIECGEIPCFPGGNGPDDRAETQKELDEQQKFINDLSPEEMDKRLADAQARKDDTGSYRPENDAQDRARTRNEYYDKETKKIIYQKRKQGIDPEIAEQEAATEILEQMKTLDAAHVLDSIAGGHEEDADQTAMRPRGANRRVGSAWRHGRRREALVNAVKKALKAGKKKMDVYLKVCEEGKEVS